MESDRLILCGGGRDRRRPKRWSDANAVCLDINGASNAVRFQIESLPSQLITDMPPAALDLMEIAAYVYAADQACIRGGAREFEYGQKWRRNFRFEIPVRDLDLWQSEEVKACLVGALAFLSDDEYEFVFRKSTKPRTGEKYLFKPAKGDASGFEEVMLFSGGLDSFAGAVHEIITSRHKVALVSHVSTEKIGKPQRDLVADIRRSSEPGTPMPLHVQVILNKDKSLGRDFTQRTRSFVFAVFAGLVAHAVGRERFRVYENGIVSFNLPSSSQIVGARASRTTHPKSIRLLSELLSAVLQSPMGIDNPFLWRTKTEILQALKSNGHAHLCAKTISCAHTMLRTTQHSHCGRCSQCVDRRFVSIAAGLDETANPEEMYGAGWQDSFSDDLDKTMFDRYVGASLEIRAMTDERAFLTRYGEVARSLSLGPEKPDQMLRNILELHKRHANQIHDAISQVIRDHAPAIAERSVPLDSPLGILCGQKLSEAHSASALPRIRAAKHKFSVCEDTLAVHYLGRRCDLGNTNEFRLIQRLARRPNNYVPYQTIIDEVWDGHVVGKRSVQKAASNLNRKLREAGIDDLRILPPSGGGGYQLTTSAMLQR